MSIRNITRDTAIHYAKELIEYAEHEMSQHCQNVGCDDGCTFDQECACIMRGSLKRFVKREEYNKGKESATVQGALMGAKETT
jgi:hypothetical protein